MTTLTAINSLEATQSRFLEGRVPRYGPILMLLARPTLLLLVQGIIFLLFKQLNIQNAAVAIRNWWTVFGTLADFGCLGLLIWLTRREGIGLRDLIGFARSKLKFDIPLGLGIFVIVFPLLWSFTEEMTYNGYALPRLIALTHSPWLSVVIVSFFFSIQHSFLSLAGFQYGFYMFLTFIPLTVASGLIYLRVRRLPPLIIGHWLMDLSSVLFMLQVG